MNHTPCPHASSGCNAPEGECNLACMTKQPEALRRLADAAMPIPLGNMATRQQISEHMVKASKAWLEFNSAASPAKVIALLDEIDRLHALCEEQKRLLEQARDAAVWAISYADMAGNKEACRSYCNLSDAITNHLRQHEGQKQSGA